MNFVRRHPNLCIMLGYILCYMLGCGAAHHVPVNTVNAEPRTTVIRPFNSLQTKDTIKHVIVDPASLKPVLSMAVKNNDDLGDIKKVLAGMDRQDKANAEVKNVMLQLIKENTRLSLQVGDIAKAKDSTERVYNHKLDVVTAKLNQANYKLDKSEEARRIEAQVAQTRFDSLSAWAKYSRYLPFIFFAVVALVASAIVNSQGDSLWGNLLFRRRT
jgi:3D (Asp-Asp-Asp) domain-containing protein